MVTKCLQVVRAFWGDRYGRQEEGMCKQVTNRTLLRAKFNRKVYPQCRSYNDVRPPFYLSAPSWTTLSNFTQFKVYKRATCFRFNADKISFPLFKGAMKIKHPCT